jgi:hypothetical protein
LCIPSSSPDFFCIFLPLSFFSLFYSHNFLRLHSSLIDSSFVHACLWFWALFLSLPVHEIHSSQCMQLCKAPSCGPSVFDRRLRGECRLPDHKALDLSSW